MNTKRAIYVAKRAMYVAPKPYTFPLVQDKPYKIKAIGLFRPVNVTYISIYIK